MNEIGARLKESREKRGISIEQVSKSIKVKEEYIQNIEDDEALVLDVFTTGYIRLYADYLRINIENKLLELKNGLPPQEEEQEEEQEEKAVEKVQKSQNEYEESSSSEPWFNQNAIKLFFENNQKYVKFITASVLTVALVFGGIFALNRNAETLGEESSQSVEPYNIGFQLNKDSMTIEKTSNDEYLLKNIIPGKNEVYILAKDSTMLTFFNEEKEVIQEVFVRIGEKKTLPEGHKSLIVKTKVPLSIEFLKN